MDKTFDAAAREPEIAALWEDAGAFRAGAGKRRDETFCILLPPPNVTGFLHAGHAFNHTLMDILVRWHRMRGFDTLWQPGLDHAGIATQLVVERQLAEAGNESRREMGRERFLEKVWEWRRTSGGTIEEQAKRLGDSMDWSRSAFTMAGAPGGQGEPGPNFHDAVIRVFVDMYEKGLITRGKRLVNWDPHFETAISDLEVENKDVAGHMWHFRYPLAGGETYEYVEKDADGAVILRETRDYISIATTRPETMLGDGAVAVHPDDPRYAPIVGKLCEIPVGPKAHRRLIPIITDVYPDPDFGSGAVKITGAHDFNDYGVAQRNSIPLYRLMDTKAAMRADGAPYAETAARAQEIAEGAAWDAGEIDTLNLVPDHLRGLDRMEARKRVVEEITAEGLAVTTRADDPRLGKPLKPDADGADAPVPLVEAKAITQPFGDRSKVVIEPMLTDQWFVDAEKIVGQALEAVRNGTVKILPESGEKTYYHWLENIEPWCISRQLWWGHQIPVWHGLRLIDDSGFVDDEGDNALDEVEIFRLLAEGLVHRGDYHHAGDTIEDIRARFEDDIAALPAPLDHLRVVEVADRKEAEHVFATTLAEYNLNQDPTRLVYPVWRDPDVLDTWFSSGLWPIGTLGWPECEDEAWRFFPTDVLITGSDILFFWVARMMMMQYAVVDQKPFHTVYLHGLVRDEKGVKMSKVLGNVIDPLELIDEYGADAVRFANAQMASLGGQLKLSRTKIKEGRNFGTKLWNAVRFAEMNRAYEGHETRSEPPTATATANRWILGETARAVAAHDKALAEYRFNDAAWGLYAYVWGSVCDWYLEFAKPLLADEATAPETRAVMAWTLDQCMILLHPIMPFVTEELWRVTATRPQVLALTPWPEPGEIADAAADREMGWVIDLIEQIRSVRAETGVPAGAQIPLLRLDLDPDGQAALDRNWSLIARLARTPNLEEAAEAPKDAVVIAVQGGTFCLPLGEVVDLDAARARLRKSLDKLEKEKGGLAKKLGNEKFVANAPEEVVDETRTRLEDLEVDAEKLAAALRRLG
ncbi:MAG: valine--tRNA ligase [Pseudomonadota bacterium]